METQSGKTLLRNTSFFRFLLSRGRTTNSKVELFTVIEMQSSNVSVNKEASSNTHTASFICVFHQPLCQRFISISPPVAWVGEPIRSYRSRKKEALQRRWNQPEQPADAARWIIIILSQMYVSTYTNMYPCAQIVIFIVIIKPCRWNIIILTIAAVNSWHQMPVNWLLSTAHRGAVAIFKCFREMIQFRKHIPSMRQCTSSTGTLCSATLHAFFPRISHSFSIISLFQM